MLRRAVDRTVFGVGVLTITYVAGCVLYECRLWRRLLNR